MGSIPNAPPEGTSADPRPARWLAEKRAAAADPRERPTVLSPEIAAAHLIPEELRAEPRWVVWKPKKKDDPAAGGHWAKVPYQPSGPRAKPNDPATWSPFEAVVAAYQRARRGTWSGIGFMLGGGFAGVDLDGVRDKVTGEVVPEAAELVREFATYTEVSPSGTGVKLIGRGEWRADWNRKILACGGEVEVYGGDRYFAVTARPTTDAGLADIQAVADALASSAGLD